MKILPTYTSFTIAAVCGLMLSAEMTVMAQSGRANEVIKDLTNKGQALEAAYTKMLEDVVSEIKSSAPDMNETHKDTLVAAVRALAEATNNLRSAELSVAGNQRVITGAGVKAAEADLKVAPVIVAAREEMLEWAKALPDSYEGSRDKAGQIRFAEGQVRNRIRDLERAPRNLAQAQNRYEQAKAAEAEVKAAHAEALAAYEKTLGEANQLLGAIGANGFLTSDQLDGKLALYKILSDGTPRGLAQFAQQSAEHERLLEQLFSSPRLMIQMVVARGALQGKYGEAAEIYAAIQKASPTASEGVLQRLAVAVSLTFAVPMNQDNMVAEPSAPEFIDPIQRYLSYEKWFLAGELDSEFETLSTWELTMTIDYNAPDEILAWGREMMRSFRPDLTEIDHINGRYIVSVNSEISYGSGDVKLDRDDRHRDQNILANGGICGRRASFGRFIMKSFGIPAVARLEPGHATSAHWTPDVWQTRFGGNWSGAGQITISMPSSRNDRTHGLNFLAITQARQHEEGFMQVLRAQWLGDLIGEPHSSLDRYTAHGLHGRGGRGSSPMLQEDIGAWYASSFIKQSLIIHHLKTQSPDFGVAATFNGYIDHPEYQASEEDRKIVLDSAGVITLPAAAAQLPEINLAKSGEMGTHVALRFMPSNLGGVQLHYGRYSLGTPFSYSFNVPQAGRYELTARLITPRPEESMVIEVNGASQVQMPMPHTTGLWGGSEPIVLELKQGENTLKFQQSWESAKGVTFRDFTLAPVN